MNKERLARNFSLHARLYDKYADIQRKIADQLLAGIKENGFCKILELGCGTGNYTFILRDKFNSAQLKAVDISSEMIKVAREKLNDDHIDFIVNDAEGLSFPEKFGLITSNACLHWLGDLEKALVKYKGMLEAGGLLAFSVFGPRTFWELKAALKNILPEVSIAADNFKNSDKIKEIMQDNFKEAVVKEAIYEEDFLSLKALLGKIKYSGIGGEAKVYFGRERLRRIEEEYLNKFGRIKATYQVFFCQGHR